MLATGIRLVLPVLGALVGSWLLLKQPSNKSSLIDRVKGALPDGVERFLFSEDLGVDLELAGSLLGPARFRKRQLALGSGGAFLAGVVSSGVAGVADGPWGYGSAFGLRQAVALCIGASVGPAAIYEVVIRRRAEKARDLAANELADLADLLCIAISAGESIRSGLARIHALLTRPLRTEIESVISAVSAGIPFDKAMLRMAERIDRPPAFVMAETLIGAHERGVGLSDQLHALAKDIRDTQRSAVIEAMGKRQMLMIVPVVFLVLPTALVFAALPGFYTLQLVVS